VVSIIKLYPLCLLSEDESYPPAHPSSAAEIRQVMNMTNATKFKRNYIDPLLELRILAMTQPDSPKSPTQKYYLTELGKQLIKK
jgi:NRPS condensation-like uncharacterized protein